ncbi:MAG: hypothetical protein RIC55_22105 [Pirellulaceae bacterium]
MQRGFALLIVLLVLATAATAVVERPAAAQRGASSQGGVTTSANTTSADEKNESKSSKIETKQDAVRGEASKNDASSKRVPGLTAGREAAVMTFVREHHPDLEALLVYLKKHRAADYAKAIRELFNNSERLARIQEMDEVRYELELAQWKLRSRIQLLVARLRMDKSDALREQLREVLTEQVELQLKVLERDRSRLSERLEKLEAKIERLSESKKQEVESQFRTLTTRPVKSVPVKVKDSTAEKRDTPNQRTNKSQ